LITGKRFHLESLQLNKFNCFNRSLTSPKTTGIHGKVTCSGLDIAEKKCQLGFKQQLFRKCGTFGVLFYHPHNRKV
jgi:hypothetical protein